MQGKHKRNVITGAKKSMNHISSEESTGKSRGDNVRQGVAPLLLAKLTTSPTIGRP